MSSSTVEISRMDSHLANGDGLPPSLEARLQELLSRLVESPGSDTVTLRLPRVDAELDVSDWDGPALLSSVRHPEEDQPEARLACASLCLLLKADQDLAAFDARESAADGGLETGQSLAEDAALYAALQDAIKETIGTAVLRGRLRAARVLSRFQEQLPPLDALLADARQTLREERLLSRLEESEAAEVARPAESTEPNPRREEDHEALGPQRSRDVAPAARRRKATFSVAGPAPQGTGWRWTAWPLLLLLLAIAGSLHVHRQHRAASQPSADERELRAVIELVDIQQVGVLLHGTVSDRWLDLDYRARSAQFQRVREIAEAAGHAAVVLVDREGHPAARWSRDSVPVVYGGRGPT